MKPGIFAPKPGSAGLAGLAVLVLFGIAACLPTDLDDQVTVTGAVLDESSGNPIENAVVRILGLEDEAVQQTDATGQYALQLTVDSTVELALIASKEGYGSDSTRVLAVPGREIAVPNLELTTTDETAPSFGTGPASIGMKSMSVPSLLVAESGGTESAELTFVVVDSAGVPVDLAHMQNVTFAFGARPNGGEVLYPTSAMTNANGLVRTSLLSGTVAGVVQVIASLESSGTVIRSHPVSVAIHGGLPDQDHLGVGAQFFNMPFVQLGFSNDITALAGDKYGNIATPGSTIYFSTTGGIIEGSAVTDARGRATVQLFSNNPYPDHAVYGPGYAVVTAHTADENDQTIQTQTLVLMSGKAQISNVTPTTFTIPNGGSETFTFTVSDPNGNPLSSGTTIEVSSASEAVVVDGDVSITLGDEIFSGPGITDFTFTVADADPATTEAAAATITIRTSGPNGTIQTVLSGSSS